ncbi:MAG: L-glutamate gamma-semialdehyde dehydrogenase [Cytophagales bacterium]|nr:MAG: L-glutamate gamma-semialdehyde dehydrogenase [Cytophagales bacterium]
MIPSPYNEPIQEYRKNSKERIAIKKAIEQIKKETIELPMCINGEWILSKNKIKVNTPHEHNHTLGYINEGGKIEIELAIQAAINTQSTWQKYTFEQRASIFLKTAELITQKYRYIFNASTMLGQSKNVYQSEIDAICELADFLRFNVKYAEDIFKIQPQSPNGFWNQMEYRPLEGFIYALTPFNFTAIAGNLTLAPALMGNTIVWKPSYNQAHAANLLMQILIEAGLPKGVINLIYADGIEAAEIILQHPDFAGLHFTGSTNTFQSLWKKIGENISNYKSYPRVVGETGGKDFIIAHESAEPKAISTALVRGAFEYQGQKCSAASRAYIPDNLWEEVKRYLLEDLNKIKTGTVENFENFINAVINENAFKKLEKIINEAKDNKEIDILFGGKCDQRKGYFIEPTVFLVSNPYLPCMTEEYFGPILSIYIYPKDEFEPTLHIINKTSKYALTGAIFAKDRAAINLANEILKNAAGNFYINDKPTGAVVNQQPFGGARASGTNDKAGSILNLLRWVSPRTVKETLNSPTSIEYPFMEAD